MTHPAVVVGLGRIGAGFQRDPLRSGPVTHAAAYVAHPGTSLVAGVDPDPGQRAAFEADYDLPTYPDLAAFAAEHRAEVVSICVPPALHAGTVVTAFDQGAVRVVCEKPCTPGLAEVRALQAALGERADRVGVNFTRRYDPMHLVLFDRLGSDLCGGNGRYTGGIRNNGSHWFANLLATGARPVEVLAIPAVDGADPTPSVLLRLASGATVYLEGHDVAHHLQFELDLVTPGARIQVLDGGGVGRLFETRQSERYSEYQELLPAPDVLPAGFTGSMLPTIDDAVRSIAEDRPMRCTLDDAAEVHRVIDAVDRSLASGGWAALA